MNKIVLKKMITKFSREFADFVFKNLNAEEKAEVKRFLDNNPGKDKAYAIWILYMTESQRRRMNPNFVRAVSEYLEKHPKLELKLIDIPSKVKKIHIQDADGGENVHFDTSDGEDVKLWKNQVTVKKELENEEKEVPTEEVSIGIETKTNNSIFVRIKRFFKKLKRQIFYRKKNRWRDKKKTNFSDKFKKGAR